MQCREPSKKSEDAIDTYILLKEGRAYENQEVVRAIFKIWLPLVRYLKYNNRSIHEATKRRKKLKKERTQFVKDELAVKQKDMRKVWDVCRQLGGHCIGPKRRQYLAQVPNDPSIE